MRGVFIILVTCLIFISDTLFAREVYVGSIVPGFKGSQVKYINNNGIFLESNNSDFGLGFVTTPGSVTLFTLSIIHKSTTKVIWSANRASPVSNSDNLLFEHNGNVVLRREDGGGEAWRLDNSGKNASRIDLRDSGNLVVLSDDGISIWESFDHPTDTLITSQAFKQGMKLTSNPSSSSNMTFGLEIKSGDMVLSVNSLTPQVYWSMGDAREKIIMKDGLVTSSSFLGNSWRFFDEKRVLLWQFIFSDNKDDNATWIAVLGNNGVISFSNLADGASAATKIPSDLCATPEPCGSYNVCSGPRVCECVPGLSRIRSDCKTGVTSPCEKAKDNATLPLQLVNAGDNLDDLDGLNYLDNLDYFALGYAPPFSRRTNLDSCKEFCNNNCSCLGLFFQNSSGNCFLFDWIGSFTISDNGGSGFVSYIKIASTDTGSLDTGGGDNGEDDGKHFPYVVLIGLVPLFIIPVLIFVAFLIHKRKKMSREDPQDCSEENSFLESLSGMPTRFAYKDLQLATNNFSVKLGQGGFGSVYEGTLPDGSRLAVKKLEGIGQGKKEFRAEVSTIGSIHHLHLVRLRGFCAEGSHRLLAYEFLSNGSLERWIFRKKDEDVLLDWDTRFNIALGTAKGLEYLHEDCDPRIVHCDIKPQNILLDDNFNAKVSDFGLAKLMTREESNVFTTLRGTRGYLAPEWITNSAISEKSDVYSYGKVLLEIIGGRNNYDLSETSERFNFPNFAFKKMGEGKLMEIVDGKMNIDVNDERVQRAIKTALWCIQEDMQLRPSMSKVVQMLEGVCPVVQPPTSSTTSSGPSDYSSGKYISAFKLSGPR